MPGACVTGTTVGASVAASAPERSVTAGPEGGVPVAVGLVHDLARVEIGLGQA
jgi:hypothetical protein